MSINATQRAARHQCQKPQKGDPSVASAFVETLRPLALQRFLDVPSFLLHLSLPETPGHTQNYPEHIQAFIEQRSGC